MCEFALGRVRLALQGTGMELEKSRVSNEDMLSMAGGDWKRPADGATVVGLLVFEPAGVVTHDAPNHWVAVRPWRENSKSEVFYRLDTVRGTFRLTHADFVELLARYPCWRLLQTRNSVSRQIFGIK